ncbi:MAG: RNA polymerase sigma factor [Enterobacterales bacterium]|nr:RNA polymerase sigma factor [Enterobacterales bacterium]
MQTTAFYSQSSFLYSNARIKGKAALDISIEQFLAQVEKKAYRMAEIATKNQADALDIVQEAMIKLVEKYSHKPSDEWKPLFYRILQSKIMDHFRRQKIYNNLFFWKKTTPSDGPAPDLIDLASDHIAPERSLEAKQAIKRVNIALKSLSPRQQQCFLLRNWEGLSIKQTAAAMNCAEGSVKTHYSRAKQALEELLAND